MSHIYTLGVGIRGTFRDVLRDRSGRIVFDSGRRNNTIVNDCHRLLAGLARAAANTAGIQGLQVGRGSESWDQTPATAGSNQTKLFDSQPFFVKADNSVP